MITVVSNQENSVCSEAQNEEEHITFAEIFFFILHSAPQYNCLLSKREGPTLFEHWLSCVLKLLLAAFTVLHDCDKAL